MKRLIIIVTFAGILLLVLLTVVLNAIADFVEPETKWTLQEINTMLDIDLPDNTSNVVIDGSRKRAIQSLDLSFIIPSEIEALQFTNQFCNGLLHARYDPFNAIDSIQPLENFVLITMQGTIRSLSYYSVSMDTPASVMGNRCLWGGAPIHIKIDKSNPLSVKVRFHMFNPCGDGCSIEGIFRNNATVH